MTKLSICIPTYNRAEYLDALFESVREAQAILDVVEFSVSDNASSDSTQQVICKWKAHLNISYIRLTENKGPDANYQSCVAGSNGDFCWFYGSDDLFRPGLIADVINVLGKDSFDILLLDRIEFSEFDASQAPITRARTKWLTYANERLIKFNSETDVINYFSACLSLGGVFSYLSSIIFRRSSWDSTTLDSTMLGTAYSHAFRLLQMIKTGGALYYGGWDVCPLCRVGNDSFYTDGWRKRFLIDILGYEQMSYRLYPRMQDNLLRKYLIEILNREHGVRSLIAFFISERGTKYAAYLKLRSLGFTPAKLMLSLLLSNSGPRSIARILYRMIRGGRS